MTLFFCYSKISKKSYKKREKMRKMAHNLSVFSSILPSSRNSHPKVESLRERCSNCHWLTVTENTIQTNAKHFGIGTEISEGEVRGTGLCKWTTGKLSFTSSICLSRLWTCSSSTPLLWQKLVNSLLVYVRKILAYYIPWKTWGNSRKEEHKRCLVFLITRTLLVAWVSLVWR